MSQKWKGIKRYPDIDDEKYHKSYRQNYVIEKNDDFLQIYKYMNVKI